MADRRLAGAPLHRERLRSRVSRGPGRHRPRLPLRLPLPVRPGVRRRHRRAAGAGRARLRAAAVVQRREARRPGGLPHLRVRAGADRLACACSSSDPWTTVVPCGDAAVERLRFQPRRREDRATTSSPASRRTGTSWWPISSSSSCRPTSTPPSCSGFAVMVFVPIRYIYPSRTPILPRTTNLLGVVWGAIGDRDPVAVPAGVAAAGARVAGVPGLLLRALARRCTRGRRRAAAI